MNLARAREASARVRPVFPEIPAEGILDDAGEWASLGRRPLLDAGQEPVVDDSADLLFS